jgi:hypothetical protein
MTSKYHDAARRGENPFVEARRNQYTDELEPAYELKFGLILYTDYPPGPIRAQRVFDLYFARFGDKIRRWTSTATGEEELLPWDGASRHLFEKRLIPQLRKSIHWGYAFDDGTEFDTWMFMFHGYRPASEPGRASFFRFEFPWNVEQQLVKNFAVELINAVPFTSGFAGYFFKPAIDEPDSYDKMYAVCQRFWGIEAWNLDVSVCYLRNAYLCVNWLTLIGAEFRLQMPGVLAEAERRAVDSVAAEYGTIFQASDSAILGDRNAGEAMDGYFALAQALMPIQVTTFESFGGRAWNDENSLEWVRRFNNRTSGWANPVLRE